MHSRPFGRYEVIGPGHARGDCQDLQAVDMAA